MKILNSTSLFIFACLLRIGFLIFGLCQDCYSKVKYTDIDYVVFSDAACYVYNGQSPYLRETYRYTPLLAWFLLPNNWNYFSSYGKVLFMICDLVTGIFIMKLLRYVGTQKKPLSDTKINILSSLWLLNPMVITISTRGSSESILTVTVMLSLYLLLVKQKIVSSGIWMGLAIHFKIYPIIYLPSIALYLANSSKPFINLPIARWVNGTNLKFLLSACITVLLLNASMYSVYGYEFLENAYFYHLGRLDHRHNFSVYNAVLYYRSALPFIKSHLLGWTLDFPMEKIAFFPQFVISSFALPLKYSQDDLLSCLFLQTFAFVTFNKVITSQYFIWFLIFLPALLLHSRLIKKEHLFKGTGILFLWVFSQALWLYFAYQLEFLGVSTFDNYLFFASCFFFLSNCITMNVFIRNQESFH